MQTVALSRRRTTATCGRLMLRGDMLSPAKLRPDGSGAMTGKLKIQLKPNERIYINGGLVKVDRKVVVELQNDVAFLIESNVLPADQATTPLRRHYLIIQALLTEPQAAAATQDAFDRSHRALIANLKHQAILEGLVEVRLAVERQRYFDAMKRLKGLFAEEDRMLTSSAEFVQGAGSVE